MSMEILIVVGVLAALAIVMLVYKVAKVAVVFGIAAACVYVGYQYVLPFWETHLAPYVAFAGSFF